MLLFLFFIIAASASYRDEVILSATVVKRTINNNYLQNIYHYGVLIQTDNNEYLIHNTPLTGVIITETQLSNKWRIVENIDINGYKTIGGALEYAKGFTDNTIINYLTSGTCIGTKNKLIGYLTD